MPISRAFAAGTIVVSASPATLESIFTGTTFGKIDIYDKSSAAGVDGTPVYSFTPAAETGASKNINIPCGTGIVAVLAAATNTTFVYNTSGRKR